MLEDTRTSTLHITLHTFAISPHKPRIHIHPYITLETSHCTHLMHHTSKAASCSLKRDSIFTIIRYNAYTVSTDRVPPTISGIYPIDYYLSLSSLPLSPSSIHATITHPHHTPHTHTEHALIPPHSHYTAHDTRHTLNSLEARVTGSISGSNTLPGYACFCTTTRRPNMRQAKAYNAQRPHTTQYTVHNTEKVKCAHEYQESQC